MILNIKINMVLLPYKDYLLLFLEKKQMNRIYIFYIVQIMIKQIQNQLIGLKLILKIDIAPIFISLQTTIEVNENTLAVHQIKTFDEEGDNIINSISGIDADEFNLSDYGLISFKSVKDFESITKKDVIQIANKYFNDDYCLLSC